MASWKIRELEAKDCAQLVSLIKEMAAYEKMESRVKITEEQIREDGFGSDPTFRCIVAETGSGCSAKLIAYAVYFFTYSTFEGRSLYLEDLYVSMDYRSQGIGTAIWKKVAQIGVERKCTRLDFIALDWNTKAIKLYESYGALNLTTKDGWNLFRLDGEALTKFASNIDE